MKEGEFMTECSICEGTGTYFMVTADGSQVECACPNQCWKWPKEKGIIDQIIEIYGPGKLLKADGFDDAILGIDDNQMKIIYSVKKCIDILMKDMSESDAVEYFEVNVAGAYVGDNTPIWCRDNFYNS